MRQVNKRALRLKRQAGFSLIEMMVVVVIIGLLVGFGGWNYLQYGRQAAVEGAARELRMFLTEAKNNARYGRYLSHAQTELSNGQVINNECYVGDLTWTTNDLKDSALDQHFLRGYGNYLEMVGSSGIVLENWAVYFDTRDPTRTTLWMQAYCRYKYKDSEFYQYPEVQSGIPPLDNKFTEKTWDLPGGIVIKKPNVKYPIDNTKAEKAGIEFLPLYLSVRYPVAEISPGVDGVSFGDSCFGEARDEIVIGDVDGKYLYKMKVGLGGDVSKGCFCQGNAEDFPEGCMVPSPQPGDTGAPCTECRK